MFDSRDSDLLGESTEVVIAYYVSCLKLVNVFGRFLTYFSLLDSVNHLSATTIYYSI